MPYGRSYRAPHWAAGPPRRLGIAAAAVVGLIIALVALLAAGVVGLPGSVGAQAGSSASGSAIELVQRHYAELASGHYQTAWKQLSPSFQQQMDYSAWCNSYSQSRIEPAHLEVRSESPTSATVVGGALVTSSAGESTSVQGQWTVTLIGGAWRLDSVSFASAPGSRR